MKEMPAIKVASENAGRSAAFVYVKAVFGKKSHYSNSKITLRIRVK